MFNEAASLSHKNRKERIFVLSLDAALAHDVFERIHYDRRMSDIEIVVPNLGGSLGDGVAEIERLAPHTVTARLIVLDVRSHTLPRLQHAYNKVVGYNRRDLNELCCTVLIGDGPLNLFYPGTSLEVFGPLLGKLRIDYSPAGFFYDPFLHYTADERRILRAKMDSLPEQVPRRLAKGFKEEALTVEAVRGYFRAANVLLSAKKDRVKALRIDKLVTFFKRRIAEAFPDNADELDTWLSREGHAIASEPLRLHLYPLFFEDRIFELLSAME